MILSIFFTSLLSNLTSLEWCSLILRDSETKLESDERDSYSFILRKVFETESP